MTWLTRLIVLYDEHELCLVLLVFWIELQILGVSRLLVLCHYCIWYYIGLQSREHSIHLEHMCQTQVREPNLARNVIIIGHVVISNVH